MSTDASILATRIADCVVLAVPDDLTEDRLRQLEEVAHRCTTSVALRSAVFDMSALKYADIAEFNALMAIADSMRILGVQPLMVGLNPGIVMHLVEVGASPRGVQTFLDLADALAALGLTTDGPAHEAGTPGLNQTEA